MLKVTYAYDRERNLWVSRTKGAHGEPRTQPVAGDSTDPTSTATHLIHEVAPLDHQPMRCVRCCDSIKPGSHMWNAYTPTDKVGVICEKCGGTPERFNEDQPESSTYELLRTAEQHDKEIARKSLFYAVQAIERLRSDAREELVSAMIEAAERLRSDSTGT